MTNAKREKVLVHLRAARTEVEAAQAELVNEKGQGPRFAYREIQLMDLGLSDAIKWLTKE